MFQTSYFEWEKVPKKSYTIFIGTNLVLNISIWSIYHKYFHIVTNWIYLANLC